MLKTIKRRADAAGLGMVVYVSMAFGNPYGDSWNEEKVVQAAEKIACLEVRSISLADTVGVAAPELINRVVAAMMRNHGESAVGVHMHSTRADAAAKVLAAYDAGCRRFDAAIGGLGGCPFAQDELVGNIPTEVVLDALGQRGVRLPIKSRLDRVLVMNAEISNQFAE
jgi:hydroxymethylglutaryl-CoA lyase